MCFLILNGSETARRDPEELAHDDHDDHDVGHGRQHHPGHGHRRPRPHGPPPSPTPLRVAPELGLPPPLRRRLDAGGGHERRRELKGAPGAPGRRRQAKARGAGEEDGGEGPSEERRPGAEEGRVGGPPRWARDAGREEELRVERRRVGGVGQDVR